MWTPDMGKTMDQLKDELQQAQQRVGSLQGAMMKAYDELQIAFKTANKQTRKQLVFCLPELTPGHYDLLEIGGFKTGSSVYADVEPDDEDWVVDMPPRAFKGYTLGSDNGWEYNDMVVLWAHYHGKILNILCMQGDLYRAWKIATDTIMVLNMDNADNSFNPFKDRLRHKWARVMLFRAIKDAMMPPKPYTGPSYHHGDAIRLKKCVHCDREARVFISGEYEAQYQKDGICDRCRTELGIGQQL